MFIERLPIKYILLNTTITTVAVNTYYDIVQYTIKNTEYDILFVVRSTCSQDTCMHGVKCVEGNATTAISCPCPPTLAGDRCESKDSLSKDKTKQSSSWTPERRSTSTHTKHTRAHLYTYILFNFQNPSYPR